MDAKKTIVQTQLGELRGVIAENIHGGQYYAFRGIPYAKPPTGNLRFKDPVPPEPWTGVRDASKYGDVCAQIDFFRKIAIGSDDCLYLNVYTKSTDKSVKLPVMVWIHGGAYQLGSGNDDIYGPDHLIRKDIVLVTINYRLGALGFMNLDSEEAPGNQGLKDQVMALRWVRENISNFGGDPTNVTIFGESAGASSVHYLIISPLAKGLFHKAIIQSGSAQCPWGYAGENTMRYNYQLSASLGKKTYDPKEIVDFLRTVDVKNLVECQERILSSEEIVRLHVAFVPSLDTKSATPFLTEPPEVAFRRGIDVPVIIGYSENEGALFAEKPKEQFFKKIDENFENIVDERIVQQLKKEGISMTELRKRYFGNEPITKAKVANYSDFLTDIMFVRYISQVIDIQLEQRNPTTYVYKFCFEPELSAMKHFMNITLPGATHADDLPYLFCPRMFENMGVTVPKPSTLQNKVMEYICQMWTDFARTGIPTPEETELIPEHWRPIRMGNTYDYLKIDSTLEMESVERDVQRFNWMKLKNKL